MKNKTETTTSRSLGLAVKSGSPSAKPCGITAPAKAKGGNITKARG